MSAKKKINNESTATEISVKNDMKRCKQIEVKLNNVLTFLMKMKLKLKLNQMNQMKQMKQMKEMKQNNQQSQIPIINMIILFTVLKHMC